MTSNLQAHPRARRGIAALLLCGALFAIGGCATTAPNGGYGNFAEASPELNDKLANDSLRQLAALYPPARTRFNLVQPTPDPYGAALVAGLRAKGYAVMESKDLPATQRSAAPKKPASGPETGPAGLDLRYVVDRQGTSNLYRVTMVIGTQSLTRGYVAQNDGMHAAGAWVRKE